MVLLNSHILHKHNHMEGGSFIIIVIMHFAQVFADNAGDAFHAKAVELFVGFENYQVALLVNGILAAGVDDGNQCIGCTLPSAGSNLYVALRYPVGSLHGIVQKVAEKGSQILVRHKIQTLAADVGLHGNMLVVAGIDITAQNDVQHIIIADAHRGTQTGGIEQGADI